MQCGAVAKDGPFNPEWMVALMWRMKLGGSLPFAVVERALFACLAMACAACGANPETHLVGRWTEVDWRYEKLDVPGGTASRWLNGVVSPLRGADRLVRHESEWWEFQPGGRLLVHRMDGTLERASWRLKGRGHVLRLRTDQSQTSELYDVKALSSRELVLHYDIGMEVRGIAHLRFRRVGPASPVGAVL